ncbi:MAG: ROK family protein [Gemmatimonadaceae bacterium]
MKVLVVDVGGTHVKVLATGRRTPIKFDSGPTLTPRAMVRMVLEATAAWEYEAVTVGYPGPVVDGRPASEPHNLSPGWVRFDFDKAFGHPVTVVNDAAMQALGSYQGGRMLFIGLGTGLGTAAIDNGRLQPLELAHLPYREGKSFEDYLGLRGLKRLRRQKWEKHVHVVTEMLRNALVADYVMLGGGNVSKLKELPPNARRGDNANAFRGGFRIWHENPPRQRRGGRTPR